MLTAGTVAIHFSRSKLKSAEAQSAPSPVYGEGWEGYAQIHYPFSCPSLSLSHMRGLGTLWHHPPNKRA
jgi:hypothetical protein